MKNLTGRVNFHRFLRLAAEVILKIECAGAGVKIGGSVTGLVGTGMVIAGNTLSLLYYHVWTFKNTGMSSPKVKTIVTFLRKNFSVTE